ncbi:glutaminyl-peptide cyclotransferase [Maricaulis sp.]|uniref:glutaminyl-peptide cyclotransferase n=1 Tax=Maricaulis sp. TaxID=1486257 RepID=UPI002613A26B|nr:glutaminyl-peptide cyclotransferase [Maricaulis sp.]
MFARTLLTALASFTLLLPAAAAQSPSVERAAIVATYPHDPDAFTQGLFIHGGLLYESTGQIGRSSLRRVELDTGDVQQQADIEPPYFGEGSVRFGDRIFMLSWVSETGFIFDADTFERIGTFSYPGEGWGLTHDGSRLVLSDGSARLRYLDPDTLEQTGTLDVTLNGRPVRRLNELEWVDGEIWANVWQSTMIVRIDPGTGSVTGLIDLEDIVPDNLEGSRDAVANGIAWDAATGRIYVTGKLWPVLHEIRISTEVR